MNSEAQVHVALAVPKFELMLEEGKKKKKTVSFRILMPHKITNASSA